LNITKCGIDSSGATELASAFYHNKSLREIHLGKNMFGNGFATILSNLAYHPTIERLYGMKLSLSGINNTEMETSLMKLFEVSTSLKYVNLYETSVPFLSQRALHGLSQNRSVQELDLSCSGLGSANISHLGWAIARNRNITCVDLENSNIGQNGIVQLSEAIYDTERAIEQRNNALRVRKLNNHETEEALRPRGCSLTRLNLSKNHSIISSTEQFDGLTRLVSLSTTLTSLDLSRCGLGVLAGDAVGTGLKNHPSLTQLNLARNQLGEHGAKKLCKGLQTNTVLTSLDISRNKIGGRGVSAITSLICNPNTNLRILNLFGNSIGIEGARFIGSALQVNKTVTDLDLGCNGMRPKGVSAIAQALPKNQTLEILRLKLNFINDRTAMELAKLVCEQQSIKRVCLAGNRIKDAILSSVVTTLSQRSPPVNVDIAELLVVTEKTRLQRTIYCTPLPFSVSETALKKVFYDGGCGAIINVATKPHAKRTSWDKSTYAFIEFAEVDSVLLALDIGVQGNAKIGKARFKVIQAQGQ